MLNGSDRLAALRLRAGRAGRARCLAALLAGACVPAIALAGCGGSSHTASTAAADASGAAAGGASATTSGTGTSSAGGAQSGTTSTTATSTTSSSAASGQGQGNGAGSAAAGGSTVKNGPNDPTSSHSGSGAGRRAVVHVKSKRAAGKTAAGSGTVVSGAGSSAGSTGSSGDNAPSANTGVPFEVQTTSMEPTFQPETKIYYDPTRTHPQIGEVVVFYLPSGVEEGSCGQVMVGGRACDLARPGMTKNKEISFKRVVGLPGDSIAIREGRVIRNGQPESEPPTLACGKDEKVECEFPTPIVIPPNDYFLMADNRGLPKEDSRIFGPVPQEYILGTVEGG